MNRSEIEEHIRSEMTRLEDAKEKSDVYRQCVRNLITLADRVVAACKSDEIGRWVAATSDSRIAPIISKAAGASVPRDELSDEDLTGFADVFGEAIVTAAAAASFLPPAATDLAKAKETVSTVHKLYAAKERASLGRAAEELAERIQAVEIGIREEIRTKSKTIIGQISKDIQRMWAVLHPGEPIEDVRLHVPQDSEKAIDIALKFYGKDLASPR